MPELDKCQGLTCGHADVFHGADGCDYEVMMSMYDPRVRRKCSCGRYEPPKDVS